MLGNLFSRRLPWGWDDFSARCAIQAPLAFLSTTTVFGTPVDITLRDIVIESFLPADARTAAAMARLMKGR